MLRKLLPVLLVSAAALAADARAPSRMVSNVYLLAQAGAMLEVCAASPDAATFPPEKSREIAAASERLTKLVESIARHYADASLPAVYSATKSQIASERALKFHVKSNHGYCNERFMQEIRAYVAENESLIGSHLERARMQPPPRK